MAVDFSAGERGTNNALDFALSGKADLFDEPLDRRRNGLVTHSASPGASPNSQPLLPMIRNCAIGKQEIS
jgi:hypothetical protein